MCGIVGILQRNTSTSPHLGPEHLDRLRHRGPDGRGLFVDGPVALGHTRLSIIDLSDLGAQPMTSEDGRFTITFNGEIYNYLELREELAAKGMTFRSRSDTEVILAAYRIWGENCVDHFSGMFAFALWDKNTQRLFCARDRCGEKPLFYFRDGAQFVFASELKCLLPLLPERPALNPATVDMYLHFQYTPEPFTLLAGVHKLSAGHFLTISLGDWDATPLRYWNIEDIPSRAGEPGVVVREKLEAAVALTLRSDVPVGVALSGGIDSAAIAALAAKHYPEPMHAFSVGYPGRPPYDERDQAKELAAQLGMIFHEVELPVDSFVDFFPQFVRLMDEPIADPAAFGHYSVPKAAADLGIKVLLTGIGGDELFWGYSWAPRAVDINRTRNMLTALPSPLRRIALSLAGHPLAATAARWSGIAVDAGMFSAAACLKTPSDQPLFMTTTADFSQAFALKTPVYGSAMIGMSPDVPFASTAIGPRSGDALPAAVLRLLFETWLVSNCLALGDRVSMAVGVETRLPFLDRDLITAVMGLRAAQPDHRLEHKAWLRTALSGILPSEVLNRPKRGFQPPVREWLYGVIERHYVKLLDGELVRQNILDARVMGAHALPTAATAWPELFFLYKLVLLECWYRMIVDSSSN